MQQLDPRLVEQIRHVLASFAQVEIATVYGSAARGGQTAASDLDIAVAAQSPLPTDVVIDLSTQLSLATEREVDLLDLQQAHGTILQEALSNAQVVLHRNPQLFCRLIKRMWYEQEDFMPIYRRILDERRARFLHGQ